MAHDSGVREIFGNREGVCGNRLRRLAAPDAQRVTTRRIYELKNILEECEVAV
jgi:hypothetical protein